MANHNVGSVYRSLVLVATKAFYRFLRDPPSDYGRRFKGPKTKGVGNQQHEAGALQQ
jgi:hypothetical protein